MYKSFRLWLIVLFTASIFLPLALLSYALATYMNRTFISETERTFAYALSSVSHRIATYAMELGNLTMAPYFDTDLMESMHDLNSDRYSNPMVASRVHSNIHAAFAQQLALTRRDVVGVLILPYDIENYDIGIMTLRRIGALQIIHMPNAAQSEWFINARALDGSLYFYHTEFPDYISEEDYPHLRISGNQSIFSVVRLIKDPYTFRPVGFLKVDATDDVLHEIIYDIPISPSSALILLDDNDHVIFSRGAITADLIAGVAAGEQRVSNGDDTYFVSIAQIAGTPWRLCHLASERDISRRTNNIYLVTALFGVLFLIAALLIFYGSTRKTVTSMNELLAAMRKIASGDLDINLDVRQRGYISTIADALNKTARRLDRHIKSEYMAVLNQRNAEYLALQSQINPHFLTNTLSGFITLNRLGERETLEKSILYLGHIFRYIASKENLSTVSGELRFVEEYLALQKMRFVDKLTYKITCDPDANDIVIPKLLLQPLVENSIIHGMEPQGKHMSVEVRAEVISEETASQLVLTIKDDGAGFDSEKTGFDNIGLSNIVERLKLFNDDADFTINSKPGEGCSCVIIIPIG